MKTLLKTKIWIKTRNEIVDTQYSAKINKKIRSFNVVTKDI